jgi:hypothetical protein
MGGGVAGVAPCAAARSAALAHAESGTEAVISWGERPLPVADD